jgi:glucose-6-phosphate 1-dehydrogenase
MYLICHGEVEIINGSGSVIETLRDGDVFGEISLLIATTRIASVRAKTLTDLFVLGKADFCRILRDHPQFAETMLRVAKERYSIILSKEQIMA